jgi:hypothetical protein
VLLIDARLAIVPLQRRQQHRTNTFSPLSPQRSLGRQQQPPTKERGEQNKQTSAPLSLFTFSNVFVVNFVMFFFWPKWQLSISTFSQIWLQATYECKVFWEHPSIFLATNLNRV